MIGMRSYIDSHVCVGCIYTCKHALADLEKVTNQLVSFFKNFESISVSVPSADIYLLRGVHQGLP